MVLTALVKSRFEGAMNIVKSSLERPMNTNRIKAEIDSRRESFQAELDDVTLSEGTPEQQKSIQKGIGELQAFHDLLRPEMTPLLLQQRYDHELKIVQSVAGDVSFKNSMWLSKDDNDRVIAPTERGYRLIDTQSRQERRQSNLMSQFDDPFIEDSSSEENFSTDELNAEQPVMPQGITTFWERMRRAREEGQMITIPNPPPDPYIDPSEENFSTDELNAEQPVMPQGITTFWERMRRAREEGQMITIPNPPPDPYIDPNVRWECSKSLV